LIHPWWIDETMGAVMFISAPSGCRLMGEFRYCTGFFAGLWQSNPKPPEGIAGPVASGFGVFPDCPGLQVSFAIMRSFLSIQIVYWNGADKRVTI
jgi:hypothetical protein